MVPSSAKISCTQFRLLRKLTNCLSAVAYSFIYGFINRDVLGACVFMVAAVVMFFKHMDNLQRIKNGTEVHFSYLWDKEKEIERIKANGATEGK